MCIRDRSDTPDGAFCSFRQNRIGSFSDGTSNSILFAERVADRPQRRRNNERTDAGLIFAARSLGNLDMNDRTPLPSPTQQSSAGDLHLILDLQMFSLVLGVD